MARISAAANEKIYGVSKWLGLNEHPDGDTRLKIGEASTMVNWKITRDGNLKRRPGTEFVAGLCESYVATATVNLYKLATFASTDTISYYLSASATTNPGTITLAAESGSVEDGVYSAEDGEVASGVFTTSTEVTTTVSNGVLKFDSGETEVTLEAFAEVLAELEEGAFVYIYYDEVPYAINSSCLSVDDDEYTLSGYRVTAEADVDEEQPIAGMWSGLCGGKQVFLAACNDCIWNIYDEDSDEFGREFLGTVLTDKGVSFFPFDNKVYILNGYEYYVYDGTTLSAVEGYRPLIAITIAPVGSESGDEAGSLTGENINRLNGLRRVWLSPDGVYATFTLPEDISAVDYVTDLSTGTTLTVDTDYTVSDNQVTFTTVPSEGTNSYEVGYSVSETLRSDVTGNLFAELFSGSTDTAVFIYGDGSNKALYSGMDYDGMPSAEYFPDEYEVSVGDSNTPITSMIRHYGVLMCFKTDSAWALSYGTTELASGDYTVAIYCTPVNRDKGNLAPGQVCLVNNNPVTCSGTELYQWINSSYYTSNLSRDERQARRISDKIQTSVNEIDLPNSCMWDDNDNQEFYIVNNGIALVWNYAVDAWYRYENFDATRMCSFQGELYLGTSDGKIRRVTDSVNGDEGVAIEAVWKSGNMDFGGGYVRKYSSMLWVGLKPEDGTSVNVCVETDRKNTFDDKVVSSEKAKIDGKPFMVRTKIKAKKFVYYMLQLSVEDKMPPVTVTDIEIRVRQTGYAK